MASGQRENQFWEQKERQSRVAKIYWENWPKSERTGGGRIFNETIPKFITQLQTHQNEKEMK